MFVRIRTGTDIAFMGGMIYWILEDMRKNPGSYNLRYVQQYTNAAYIINSDIRLPGDAGQNGLFSVWDSANRKYDTATWKYAVIDARRPSQNSPANRLPGYASSPGESCPLGSCCYTPCGMCRSTPPSYICS